MMDRWQAMRIFSQVAETGGFARAARDLHMSAPAVTRAVAALEETIGTRLLVRTTRSVKLTAAGQGYYDDCRRILADITEAEANAAGSFANPAGTLTITAPVLFGRLYVLPLVLDFLALYPAVNVRTVFVDRVTNLIDEGMDVAVRIAHLPDSSLSATRVGSVRRVTCGAPGYFAKNGIPRHPADLKDHSLIGRNGLASTDDWYFGADRTISVEVSPRLTCNTNDAAIAAAISGWGVSRFLSYQVAQDVLAGTLQIVLADYEEAAVPVHIVHAEGRAVSARVRAFVDFAASRLRANRLIN